MQKKPLLIICIAIVCILIAPYILTRNNDFIYFDNTSSVVGDTIGGITAPIIGLVSILLLYWTLSEQIEFNKKQKQLSFEEQFKTTLFNLLNIQREITKDITGQFKVLSSQIWKEKEYTSSNNTKEISGIHFFKLSKEQLHLIFNSLNSKEYYNHYDTEQAFIDSDSLSQTLVYGSNVPQDIIDEQNLRIKEMKEPYKISYINKKYGITEELYNSYQNQKKMNDKIGIAYAIYFNKYENVGYYFRHLYRILKYIKSCETSMIEEYTNNISEKEKNKIHNMFQEYAQFIQSQMSVDELTLLYYNSFMFKRLQDLIIEYNLLENLTIQNLIDKSHYCNKQIKLKDKTNFFRNFITPKQKI